MGSHGECLPRRAGIIRKVIEPAGMTDQLRVPVGAQLRDVIWPRGWIAGANVGKTDLGADGPRHGCNQKGNEQHNTR